MRTVNKTGRKNQRVAIGSPEVDGGRPLIFENLGGENTRLMKVDEAAEFLDISQKALRVMISRSEVPFFRIGRRIRFSRETLERWVAGKFFVPQVDRISFL